MQEAWKCQAISEIGMMNHCYPTYEELAQKHQPRIRNYFGPKGEQISYLESQKYYHDIISPNELFIPKPDNSDEEYLRVLKDMMMMKVNSDDYDNSSLKTIDLLEFLMIGPNLSSCLVQHFELMNTAVESIKLSKLCSR